MLALGWLIWNHALAMGSAYTRSWLGLVRTFQMFQLPVVNYMVFCPLKIISDLHLDLCCFGDAQSRETGQSRNHVDKGLQENA